MRKLFSLLGLVAVFLIAHAGDNVISLSGQWHFALDPDSALTALSPLDDMVTLPGTTDTNEKGTSLSCFDETTHLSRRHSYKGRAWYSREVVIPQEWEGKTVTLLMERSKSIWTASS